MATINPNKILIRSSNTAGVDPTSLTQGTDDTESTAGAATEIAINRADGKLYYLNASDTITEFRIPDQAVNTTSAVTFATVDTGQGANELYDMNQNVKTTSSPTFVGLTLTGDLAVNGNDITSTGSIDIGGSESKLNIGDAGYKFYEYNNDESEWESYLWITANPGDPGKINISPKDHGNAYTDSGMNNSGLVFENYSGRDLLTVGYDSANVVSIKAGPDAAGTLRIYEDSDHGSYYSGFTVGNMTANALYRLPLADGSANQVLKTDGSKNLSWTTATLTSAANTFSAAQTIATDSDSATAPQLVIGADEADGYQFMVFKGEDADYYMGYDSGGDGSDNDFMFGIGAEIDADDSWAWLVDEDGEMTIFQELETREKVKIKTDKKLQFRDTAIYISSTADGDLSIVADDEIDLTSTLIDINGNATVSGDFSLDGSNKELRFYEGVNYVGFEAPALAANQIWVLPTADGSSGQLLKTNGSGTLSWVTDANDNDNTTYSASSTSAANDFIGGVTLPSPHGGKFLRGDGSWQVPPDENDNTTYSKASFDLDHLYTLVGASADTSEDLGTFTGSTITDSRTIKEALQDLETAMVATSAANTFTADQTIGGTTPTLTIGDAGTEDTFLIFDGNAADWRLGIDDSEDLFEIGVGAAHATTPAITINSSGEVTTIGQDTHTSGQFLKYDGSKVVWSVDNNDNTWTALSTSNAGYVAALPSPHGGKFLKADGSWAVPAYTTNTNTTTTADVKTALGAAMGSNALTIGDGSTITTFPGDIVVTGTTKTASVEVISTSTGVIFEGGTDDGHEAKMISAVADADITYTFPNVGGYGALFAANPSTTTISSTPAELNILDGVTATATELNYLDITTLGTAAASKALTIKGDSTWTVAGMTCADLGTVTTIDINGGTINGITDLAVADGGTGASNASGARTNLGLVIGTNVQAYDANIATTSTNWSAADITSGTLAVGRGGTGVTTMSNLKNALDDETWTFAEKVTADAGIDIDNFNIDGTTIALSSGNMTFDCAGNNTDIIFKGTDGSQDTTYLTIDGSDGGTLICNGDVQTDNLTVGNTTVTTSQYDVSSGNFELDVEGDITLDANGADIHIKDDGTTSFSFVQAANSEIDVPRGNLTLDVAGDIVLDAEGKDISLTDGSGTAEFIFNLEAAPELDVDGDFTIDCSGDIALSADGDTITMDDGQGNTRFTFNLDATPELDINGNFKIDSSGTLNLQSDSGAITLDSNTDIALSADGGNVTMDDGQGITVFDFNTDDVIFKMMDDADTGDYFSMAIGSAGATTISTVDDGGAAAHLTIAPDGNLAVNLASGAEFTLQENSGTYTPTADTHVATKKYVDDNAGSGENNVDAYGHVAVSGQTTCDADQDGDTLTLVAAGGMTITTSNDDVTLSSANTTYSAGNGLALSGTTFSIIDPVGNLSELTESNDATDDKILLWDESASSWLYMTLDNLQDSIDTTGGGGGGITVNSQADNRIMTTTAVTDTVQGESNLTYDGADFANNNGTISASGAFYSGGAAGVSGSATFMDASFALVNIASTGGVVTNNGPPVSDERMKENIAPFNTGLSLINQVEMKSFKYIDEYASTLGLDENSLIGVIAQDIEAIDSEYITENDDGMIRPSQKFGYELRAAMHNALKELSAKNDALEARIAALEAA